VNVFDDTEDGFVNLLIEQRGVGQASIIPTDLGGTYKGQDQPLTFKPNHTYRIEAYIMACAYLWPEGRAQAQVSATIRGMKLASLQPPWIKTRLLSVSNPDADTWDLYERALARQGRHYYTGATLLEVSAGGNFNWGYVDIRTMYPESEITGVVGTTLPVTLNAGGEANSARITLSSALDLPLQGKTWRFTVGYDPHYQNPWDYLVAPEVPIMPLVAPVIGMWAETSQAAQKLVVAQLEQPPYRSAVVPVAVGGGQHVEATAFYDLTNYSVVLPASRFLALSRPATKTLPAGTKTLPISVYTPPSASTPQFNADLLKATSISTLPEGVRGFELNTEPVVIISLLSLWQQFLGMEHLLLQTQNLEWCANPHFIRLLEQVGGSAEAHREWLDALYWMPRGGDVAIKLVDLPDYVESRIQETSPQYPLWMVVAGVTVAVVIVLSPRLRRWARRVFTVDQVRLWIEMNRPAQSQTISAAGRVRNSIGQEANSASETPSTVFFDTVPQRYIQGGVPPDLA
jgi:hypothetical protein